VADTPEHVYQVLETSSTDVVLLDLRLPGNSGLEVLREIKQRRPDTLVIVMTGFATVQSAVQAMKLGAYDTSPNPSTSRTAPAFGAGCSPLEAHHREPPVAGTGEVEARLRFPGGARAGDGEAVPHCRQGRAQHPSRADSGESGTGKELVARSIHYSGPSATVLLFRWIAARWFPPD